MTDTPRPSTAPHEGAPPGDVRRRRRRGRRSRRPPSDKPPQMLPSADNHTPTVPVVTESGPLPNDPTAIPSEGSHRFDRGDRRSFSPKERGRPPERKGRRNTQRETDCKRRRNRGPSHRPCEDDGPWWAFRWAQRLEALYQGNDARYRLQRGRTYALRGQVFELDIGPHAVLAKVQGSRAKPYHIRLEFNRLRRETWGRILSQLATRAEFAAQLLAGQLPVEIEEVFWQAGARLFPDQSTVIRARCSCPDPLILCKHIAAVHYALIDALCRDPFLLFALRGKTRDQLLQDLCEVRVRDPRSPGTRPAEAPVLDRRELENFWRLGHLPEVALRRTGSGSGDPARLIHSLGEPSFDGLRGSLVMPILETTYRQVAEAVRRLPKEY